MRATLDRAEAANRDLSSAEEYEFDQMELELRRLSPTAQLAHTTRSSTAIEYRIGGDGVRSFEEWRSGRHAPAPQDDPEYTSAFWNYVSSPDLRSFDPGEYRALSRATGAAGNYLVPTDFSNQIVRVARHMGALGELARVINTSNGETLQVPANTAHGVATWTAENAAYTPSDETFAQVELGAFKAATKIIVSEELLQDSAFPLDSYLAGEFGERIGALSETAFIIGNGSGKPEGVLATDATTNVTLHTAATGNSASFTYSALVTAIFALPPQYRQNAAFIVNDLAAPQPVPHDRRREQAIVERKRLRLWAGHVFGLPGVHASGCSGTRRVQNQRLVRGLAKGIHNSQSQRIFHATPGRATQRFGTNRV